nr:hypothetical protein [Serratia proteamaculans]
MLFFAFLPVAFSYEYFEKALKDTATKLNKVINPSEEQQFSKFFVSSMLNDLGIEDSFDSLIENNNIDILIQLGITHVTNDTGKINKKITRYIKKLKNQYSGNKRMSNYITDLHEKTIIEIENKRH